MKDKKNLERFITKKMVGDVSELPESTPIVSVKEEVVNVKSKSKIEHSNRFNNKG